ncbi:MAG: LysR family transcriptional regulator [Xanthomonadales bacterium]|nr:LysR family transcriptional regulator [Xanthomonadales bacterium]
MNWDDIRIFLALCRQGSVSRAGSKLGVTHTTVARRVNAFEEQLGTRLFDRSRDGYAMTQAAEDLYERAVEMEQTALAIDRAVGGQDAELRGQLKVTAPYDFANSVLVPRLGGFRQEYPCIDLELLTTTGLIDLAAREADIAVRLTARPPDYLIGRKVLPLQHGVYGAPKVLRKPGDAPEVILFRSEQNMPEWVEQHFPGARVALKTDNLSTMLAAVAAGLGLARMPCYEADRHRDVRRLDLELTPSTWGVWVLSHVDLRSAARVRAGRAFMVEVIESQASLILGERSRYMGGSVAP